MSRAYDGKQAALAAYPEERDKAIDLFLAIMNCDTDDLEYELGMSVEEYIFGGGDGG